MAVTGEFLADFADFVRGAKTADAELDKLEGHSDALGSSLDKSLSGVNFEKFLSDPLKEGTKLAKEYAATIPAIGVAGVAAAAGVVALGVAVAALASKTADTASNLGDLHDKTGASLDSLSRLSNAAGIAGTSVEALSGLSYTMQKRMAENPDAFAKGLKDLGLNAAEFKNQGMDQQLRSVGDALNAQADPQQRIIAGNALMGKQFAEMGPALMDLGAAMDATKDKGHIFTPEEVKAAEDYKTQVGLMKLEFTALGQAIGTEVLPYLTEFLKKLNTGELLPYHDTVTQIEGALNFMGDALEFVGVKSAAALPPVKALNATTLTYKTTLEDFEKAAMTTSGALEADKETTRQLDEQKKAYLKTLADAEAAEKKYAEAMTELNAAGEGWRGTLAGVNEEFVSQIQWYLDAGVSQGALAEAYGLTAVQVKAVATALTEERKTLEETQKFEQAGIAATQSLWAEYYKTVRAGSADTTQKQIDDVWAQASAAQLALGQVGTYTKEAYDLITRTAQAATDNIVNNTLIEDRTTQAHYADLAAKAEAAYAFAQAHAEQYTTARIDQLRREAEAADATLQNWQTVAEASLTQVGNAADATTQALQRTTSAAAAAAASPVFGGTAPNTGIIEQERYGQMYSVDAATGQVIQGLERKYGAGGFLGYGTPASANAPTVHVNMNGMLLSTDPAARAQLMGVISRTVTDTLKNQGVKLGNGV